MYLLNSSVRGFRNLRDSQLEWGSGFNILWGENAQGKTNLLESIYLLGHLKSFRSARGTELIAHNAAKAVLGGAIKAANVINRIELVLEQGGRIPSINGKKVRKLSDFLGYLRPILFTPEEMELIKGYPAGRRALLDRAIVQQDPLYLDRAQEFYRILKQRNLLLKQEAGRLEIEPWTRSLIVAGAGIRRQRSDFLKDFKPLFREAYQEIAENREQPEIDYPYETSDRENLEKQLHHELERQSGRERQYKQTLAGPHRDNPEFLIDGRPLRTFGSQGQQRSFLLAFKSTQVISLEQQLGESPVLLLDDLTSELDWRRQQGFFKFLLTRRGQVFITTTRPNILGDHGPVEARFYQVFDGSVNIQ